MWESALKKLRARDDTDCWTGTLNRMTKRRLPKRGLFEGGGEVRVTKCAESDVSTYEWYRGLLEVKGRVEDRGGRDRRGETSPREVRSRRG